ncbi:MAG: PepSY-like domain-containing protein, partial [Paludibacteraceae bacterium]|nr:PepSY-like domain-containing protein [Paludibacteraceae bacterium]
RTTLKEQFSNEEVSFIKIDRDFIRKSYEVQFVSGNEVAFNNKGEWTEIEFDKSSVPATFIPSDIQKLVDSMFKGQQIRKIEKDMYGHEIELSDGRDLKFDKKNRLFKMDD